MSPQSIPRIRREDFHTDASGTRGENQQYIGFANTINSVQKRPVSVLHLLDQDGSCVDSRIWEADTIEEVEESLKDAIANLPKSSSGNLSVKPFSVELNGLNMGFIERADGVHDLAFFPLWNR